MISLYDLLEASNGQLFGEPVAQLFTRIALDARQVQESELFVAIKSDYGDTHQEMQTAVANGAAGLLCTHPPDFDTDGVSVIVVRDTETALMLWAHYVLGRFGTKAITVTGTAGKSTTLAAITQILETKFNVHSNIPAGDTRLGVPLALADLTPEHDFVVLELAASQPGELAQMVQSIEPTVVVVTNIGEAYMNNFTSVDQIVGEHRQLIELLSPSGLVVLNYDDDRVRELVTDSRAPVLTVGAERFGADLMAYNIKVGQERIGFDLRFKDERHVGRWAPLLGRHQIYNLLMALAIGVHYDISLHDGLRAITELEPLPGRLRPLIGINNSILIDDSHTANPTSALAALDFLETVRDDDHRVIFVLGDMDNLGQYSQYGHRKIGQRAAEVADVLITEGAQAAIAGRAAQDIAPDYKQVLITYSMNDTLDSLTMEGMLSENDILLVKGGEAARMELLVKSLLREDDTDDVLTRQDVPATSAIRSRRPLRPSWVEIDREGLANNVRRIREYLGDDVKLMATVKADAYGHGAIAVSRIALKNGADYLAVASMAEALVLREAGIEAPILILSYTPVYAVREAIRYNITVTVYDLEIARAYQQAAREVDGRMKVHVKIDTGMGRLGVLVEDAVVLFRHLATMDDHLYVEGVYTHFSSADENETYTADQLANFRDVLKPLRAAGIKFDYVHAANSAAMLLGDSYHFDMVRAGLALYGYPSSQIHANVPGLRRVMTWKTVIAQVKTLPPGHPVGYGNTYYTSADERVAVIPVGYGDGFRRAPQNWGEVLVGGKRAPIRGRVSMEKTVISVQDIPDVVVGNEVVLLGTQGDEEITADELAERLETINYEILTSVLPRVPR